jgi:hypothetical protein
MKYLRKYNESTYTPLNPEIKTYLEDILSELEDSGIYTYIEDSVHNKLSILVSDSSNAAGITETGNTFNLTEDVWTCLHHLTDYLKDEGYKISYISFNCLESNEEGIQFGDSADNIEDFKRIVNIFSYGRFKYITLRYTYSYKR